MFFNKNDCEYHIVTILKKCDDAVILKSELYSKNYCGLCFFASYELFLKLSYNPDIKKNLFFCIGNGHSYLIYNDLIIDPTIQQISKYIKKHVFTQDEFCRLQRKYNNINWNIYNISFKSNNINLIDVELSYLTEHQQPFFVNKLLSKRNSIKNSTLHRIYDSIINDKTEF